MSPHYVPLRALRWCCHWIAARKSPPQQIPVVISRSEPADHGAILLLDLEAK